MPCLSNSLLNGSMVPGSSSDDMGVAVSAPPRACEMCPVEKIDFQVDEKLDQLS